MENSAKKLLQRNYDEWSIFSILNNTKINEKTVLGWKFVSGQKVTVEVMFYIIRKSRKEILVRAISRQGKTLLAELAASANNLNFYLPDDMVLFQAELKQIEPNGDVRIAIPKMIAQVDRRKNFRLMLENGLKVETHFEKSGHDQKNSKHFFKKECFDISASGLAFIVSNSEKKFFKDTDRVKNIHVQLEKEEMIFDAKVVGIVGIEPNPHNNLHYKGWKIALEFISISSENAKIIDNFVFRFLDLDKAI